MPKPVPTSLRVLSATSGGHPVVLAAEGVLAVVAADCSAPLPTAPAWVAGVALSDRGPVLVVAPWGRPVSGARTAITAAVFRDGGQGMGAALLVDGPCSLTQAEPDHLAPLAPGSCPAGWLQPCRVDGSSTALLDTGRICRDLGWS